MSKLTKTKTAVVVRRHEGAEVLLPTDVDLAQVMKTIRQMYTAERTRESAVIEFPEFFFSEVMAVMPQAIEDVIGFSTSKRYSRGAFGPPVKQLDYRYVHKADGTRVAVPVSKIEVPAWDQPGDDDDEVKGWIQFHVNVSDYDRGPQALLQGSMWRKYRPHFDELVDRVKTLAREQSPYKGQAVRLVWPTTDPARDDPDSYQPQFLKIDPSAEEMLVLSGPAESLVEDSLFGPVEHTTEYRRMGQSLRIGALLSGEPGTGKTLTTNALAQKCVRNGWTFLAVDRPDSAMFVKALEFARRWQPVVVCVEDIDRVLAGEDRTPEIDNILNTMDGIEKGGEIVTVLTSNKPDAITSTARRHGRCDVHVAFDYPDVRGAERLIRQYGAEFLDFDEDYTPAAKLLDGAPPASIREAVYRAQRSAIRRLSRASGGLPVESVIVLPEDVERAAEGIRADLEAINRKAEPTPTALERSARITGDAYIEAARVYRNGNPVKGEGSSDFLPAMPPMDIQRTERR